MTRSREMSGTISAPLSPNSSISAISAGERLGSLRLSTRTGPRVSTALRMAVQSSSRNLRPCQAASTSPSSMLVTLSSHAPSRRV